VQVALPETLQYSQYGWGASVGVATAPVGLLSPKLLRTMETASSVGAAATLTQLIIAIAIAAQRISLELR